MPFLVSAGDGSIFIDHLCIHGTVTDTKSGVSVEIDPTPINIAARIFSLTLNCTQKRGDTGRTTVTPLSLEDAGTPYLRFNFLRA